MTLSSFLQPLAKKKPLDEAFLAPRVIVLAGPTAVGKTALSLLIAQTVKNAEIISADSMQVYRGMDIGTAKASWRERLTVPHHMIDVREINQPFNVVDFFYEARTQMSHILKRGKTPIIIGGAGFYLRSLLTGPPSGPPSVASVREKLEDECEKEGVEALLKRLIRLDPLYAKTISSGDRHKIIRALEIITLTQKPVSAFKAEGPLPSPYSFRCWFLCRDRTELYKRIEERCEEMLREGLIDEVFRLKREGLLSNASAAQSIGYRQSLSFLESAQTPTDFKQMVSTFKTGSRHLAKRQLTWFRKEPEFRWLDLDRFDVETAASMILKDYWS